MTSPKTALLLHFNGSDGDVLFLDNSANKHVITPNGNVQIDSAQSRFGGVSGRFDGAADYLTLDGSTDFVFADDDLTIDCWLRLNAVDKVQAIYDGRTVAGGVTPYLYIGSDNLLKYEVDGVTRITGSIPLFPGIWYHVALTRHGTATKLFLNGMLEGEWTDVSVYVAGTATSPFIGAERQLANYFDGWLDELRVIQGEAAWTEDFSVPVGPYADPVLPSMSGIRHGVRTYSGDRHVRRGGDDYTQAFGNLLPTGLAWSRDPDSVLMKVVKGLSQVWGNWVDRRAADLLETESDPRLAYELLSDWERAWGLPDDCFFGIGQTLSERRKFLVLKMTLKGGQSREWFIGVSEQLGYEVSVSEFAPFMCGVSRLGDTRQMDTGVNKFVGEFIAS